jgi:hypothetical protein
MFERLRSSSWNFLFFGLLLLSGGCDDEDTNKGFMISNPAVTVEGCGALGVLLYLHLEEGELGEEGLCVEEVKEEVGDGVGRSMPIKLGLLILFLFEALTIEHDVFGEDDNSPISTSYTLSFISPPQQA